MSVLLVEKTNISDPMKWFCDTMEIQGEWQKDPHLDGYKIEERDSEFYYCDTENYHRFEDFSNFYFVGWDTETWLNIAQGRVLIYGYFSDDDLSAEFIHFKNGECIREFREYSDYEEDNIDLGISPKFDSWVDVASYVERM